MFTHKLLSDVKYVDVRRRIINVEFTNNDQTINKEFQFSITDTPENIKRVIAQYIDELNFEPEPITDLVVPEPEPEDAEKVAFEAAKSEWLQKKQVLSTMIEDMQKGRELGIAPDETQIAIMQSLAQWVNENMKQEYYF